MHGGRHPRHEAREHGSSARITGSRLPEERAEVAQHLVRIEADPHVLDAQRAVAVDERGQERVVDVAAVRLPGEDAVALDDVPDLRRRPGEERPARRVRAVRLRVAPQDGRGVALGIDGDRRRSHLRAEVLAQPLAEGGQLRREERARVGARRVDEGDGDDLAAQVGEDEPSAVCGRQRERGRRSRSWGAARHGPARGRGPASPPRGRRRRRVPQPPAAAKRVSSSAPS